MPKLNMLRRNLVFCAAGCMYLWLGTVFHLLAKEHNYIVFLHRCTVSVPFQKLWHISRSSDILPTLCMTPVNFKSTLVILQRQ